MGRHFPAMAVVEITRLVEPLARLEIEATAAAAILLSYLLGRMKGQP